MSELFKPTLAQIASFQEWCDARDALNSKIGAFILLYGDISGGEALALEQPAARGIVPKESARQHADVDADEGNMTGAIEHIVNSRKGQKIKLKQLKQALRNDGFPEERLKNYFYTAVRRLGTKDRIKIWPDKSISQLTA